MFLTFVFSFFHLLYYLVFTSLSFSTPVFFVSFLLLSHSIFYRAIYRLIYIFSYFAFPLSPLLISTLILLTLFVHHSFSFSLSLSPSLSLSLSLYHFQSHSHFYCSTLLFLILSLLTSLLSRPSLFVLCYYIDLCGSSRVT